MSSMKFLQKIDENRRSISTEIMSLYKVSILYIIDVKVMI